MRLKPQWFSWLRPCLLVAISLGTSAASAAESLTVGSPTVDANGALHYALNSSYQGGATDLRILLPTTPIPGQAMRFLYMLPVQAGTATTYGDGLAEAERLNLANRYNVIIVAPTFRAIDPWYADNLTNLAARQESYFLNHIIPTVDSLYPQAGGQTRELLGFSKSGFGAMSLILRHPTVFDKAAIFDAPLSMTDLYTYDGMWSTFGTEANFDAYAIPDVLAADKGPFLDVNRLWLSTGSNFGGYMQTAHNQMNALGIDSTYVVSGLAHRWDSGWVEGAAAFVTPEPGTLGLLGLGLLGLWNRKKK